MWTHDLRQTLRLATRLVTEGLTLALATLTAAVTLLGAATMIASYLPARRAARLDPVSVLAAE
jgi:ABC-type lipoprotein release transport system permease subunit